MISFLSSLPFLNFFKYKLNHLLLILLFITLSNKIFAQQVRQTILFNNDWKFYKGDTANANATSFNDNAWRQLSLPHDWSIEGPYDEKWASATAYLPAGIGWYRKTFTLPDSYHSKNIYIYFDGVYKNSEVWINGHYLGKRPNGFIAFQYELTRYLNPTGKNIIAVKADHTQFADSRWYTGSGIYRNVYLIAENPVSIDLWGVAFSTSEVSAKKAVSKVTVAITNKSVTPAAITVKLRLLNSAGQQEAEAQQVLTKIKAGEKGNAALTFNLNNPVLWSIEHPELYKLEVSLFVQGKKIDDITQQVGFRFFRFDKDKGFLLNDKNIKLKGVCIHDDAGALGVAVPEEVWQRRLQILKDGGCNSLRLSHNPHANYLYNLCDSMGFLVIDEAFDEWESGKNKWIKGWNVGKPGQDGYHEYFKEWADKDLGDMVLCNRNHPSIFMWSIGNEIDYPNDPYTDPILNTGRNPQIYGRGYSPEHPSASRITTLAKQLTTIVKQFDITRPVTAALAGVVMSNEVSYPEVLDVVGYNYQEFRYTDDHKKYPDRIIYDSENGMKESAWEEVVNNDFIAGQYVWTGIDYLGEARQWPFRSSSPGLIDMAGFTKPQYYFRQSLWSAKPMIYIGTIEYGRDGKNTKLSAEEMVRFMKPTWNYKEGDSIRVSCFTNCQEAELFNNDKSLGKKLMSDAHAKTIFWDAVYQPGELVVKGYNNGKEITSYQLNTTCDAYSIDVKSDKKNLTKSTKQLAQVTINILDKNGNIVYDANNELTVTVDGPAKLLGLENGSLNTHEVFGLNKHKVLNGKLLAYVQLEQKTGIIKLRVTAAGLPATEIRVAVNN